MPIHFALLHGAETEIDKIKDNGKIERETNLDRRGPKQIGTVWRIPDPPIFSLPTTFKGWMVCVDRQGNVLRAA